ncbi:MAG: MFS transporter [Burkholderiales bacterium]|nr:MFS transporter [Burkholderiales bacterium]MDE2276182.1 MFS transporter [Burkholderiales bacterium]
MDASSEMIHALLPMFLVTTLGTSVEFVGFLEGAAEATTLVVKMFSGALSDALGRRKGLAVFGYGLAALTKPLFALAPGVGLVVTARLLDRVGKGIRGAPRDALIADITPRHLRGAAYGLRQSLDTIGAVLGPVVAIALMLAWQDDFRAVFWVATVPAALAVGVLAFGLREPAPAPAARRPNPIGRAAIARLSSEYWRVVAFGAAFTLARFSEAFLVLRAQQSGVPIAWVPAVMVAMNLVYAASAYPFGRLADRLPPRRLLAASLPVLMAADALLAMTPTHASLLIGVALWGLHMGMSQGLLATMVANAAPADLRGTAYGVFNLVSGVFLIAASTLAGLLWDRLGAPATFHAGAAFSALALLLLVLTRPR